jgi:hypothetical protein
MLMAISLPESLADGIFGRQGDSISAGPFVKRPLSAVPWVAEKRQEKRPFSGRAGSHFVLELVRRFR